jgi:hypothetical protein
MKHRRGMRPQRKLIFIGCEGQSEVGYAAWLRNFVLDKDLPFHLALSDLGKGAGDPLARVQLAIERIERHNKNREPYVDLYLFLDSDQLLLNAGRAAQARALAHTHKVKVIWQDPTHEAFLLRHLPGCDTRRPPDKSSTDQMLGGEWENYCKPSTARQLERRLKLEGAFRVARTLPELAQLLRTIGLLND